MQAAGGHGFFRRLSSHLGQVAGQLALGSICGLVMNTAVVLPALLLGRAIDAVLALERGTGSAGAVQRAALLYVLGSLATELPRVGKRWWLVSANNRIAANIRADAYAGVIAWPMDRLHGTRIGDLMARMGGDVDVVARGIRELTVETWDSVVFSISIVVALFVIDPTLTAGALVPVPFAMYLARQSGRWVARRTAHQRAVNAELTAAIQEHLAGVRVLSLFGRRELARDAVRKLSHSQAEASLALTRLRNGLQPAYSTLMTTGVVVVVWLGGERVVAGAMSVGTFVAYVELFLRFTGRAHRVPQLVNAIQSATTAFERLAPLLAPPASTIEPAWYSFAPDHLMGAGPATPAPPPPDSGPLTIRATDLTFTYPGATAPALRDLNLEVPAGAFIAITGPVGSGKSALARCLAGIFRPAHGALLLDGAPADVVAPRRVGYMPQDAYLFSGTVRENVFLEDELEARPRELDPLLELSELSTDVRALPAGADTQIGELGVRVSGGQRQRLALARAAAAGRPGLLVLDDPFSAVDVDTEARILENLRRRCASDGPHPATLVLFSHRLAAFPHADRIVVLDAGHIAEQGDHAELLRAGGVYARIYRAQRETGG